MLMARIDTPLATPVLGPVLGDAPSVGELADHLQGEMTGLEDAFRQTGEALASAIDTIDGLAQGLAAIRESLSPETAGVAVTRLRDVAYRLITLPMIQARRAVEVETLNGRTRELRGLLGEVGMILKLLGIYGMNIKIASSGEPSFLNFVVGMDEKLASGRNELRHIEQDLGQFNQVIGEVQAADQRLARECASAGGTVPSELTGNANALQDHVNAVMRTTDEVAGIMRTVQGEVARILGAIQIGDSVRQRAEHVITILRRIAPATIGDVPPVPPGAAAHLARLAAAQMEAMSDDFGREIVAIVQSLERLGPLADHLRTLLGSHNADDGQILVRLELDIAKLTSVTDQLCDADGHLAELTGFVSRTLADLTQGLSRIRNIATSVQDISTNTQLLCRRHGTLGRAVAVIAKEVAPCASRLDQLSVAVGRLVGVLAAIDLVQDSTQDGTVRTRGALNDALAVVRAACESSSAVMAKGDGDAQRVLASLQASASDLAEQRAFADTLATAAQGLALYAGQQGHAADAGALTAEDFAALTELLPWAGSLYTMACERVIHADFLLPGMAVPAPSVAAVTFDDDDDGLF